MEPPTSTYGTSLEVPDFQDFLGIWLNWPWDGHHHGPGLVEIHFLTHLTHSGTIINAQVDQMGRNVSGMRADHHPWRCG